MKQFSSSFRCLKLLTIVISGLFGLIFSDVEFDDVEFEVIGLSWRSLEVELVKFVELVEFISGIKL